MLCQKHPKDKSNPLLVSGRLNAARHFGGGGGWVQRRPLDQLQGSTEMATALSLLSGYKGDLNHSNIKQQPAVYQPNPPLPAFWKP